MKKTAQKSMVGGKAGSRKMLGKKKALSHDLPEGFDMAKGKAAGKTASAPVGGKPSRMAAKPPMKMRKASRPMPKAQSKAKKKA